VSDSRGGIYKPGGLDVDSVYKHRLAGGLLDDHPGADHDRVTNEELLQLPVDILVPAALEGQITEMNAGKVRAKMIIEAANGPVTPRADEILTQNGVFVVPDIVANAGGVIVSYFEWVQDLQSFFWEESEVNTRLQKIIINGFNEVTAMAQARNLRLREAAYVVAVQRVVEAINARGIYP
jgi:glutamate dehydrogenase (NAD(P)+)